MTMKEAAQKTLDVQNACNLSGVALSFTEVMAAMSHMGAKERDTHPISRLWVDKMASLAGIQGYDWDYYSAYAEVMRLTKEEL